MTADPTGTTASEPADAVATAVTSLRGVAGLHAGMFGEVATYLPGRRVVGLRLLDDVTHVHVVATWDAVLPELARDIQAAVAPIVGTDVFVTIEDVEAPGNPHRRAP